MNRVLADGEIKEQRQLDRDVYKTGLLPKGPVEQGETSVAKSITDSATPMMRAKDVVPAAGDFTLIHCHHLLCSNAGKIYCTTDL